MIPFLQDFINRVILAQRSWQIWNVCPVILAPSHSRAQQGRGDGIYAISPCGNNSPFGFLLNVLRSTSQAIWKSGIEAMILNCLLI